MRIEVEPVIRTKAVADAGLRSTVVGLEDVGVAATQLNRRSSIGTLFRLGARGSRKRKDPKNRHKRNCLPQHGEVLRTSGDEPKFAARQVIAQVRAGIEIYFSFNRPGKHSSDSESLRSKRIFSREPRLPVQMRKRLERRAPLRKRQRVVGFMCAAGEQMRHAFRLLQSCSGLP
jgi:hypothetical protein